MRKAWRRFRAVSRGYFWACCPVCGTEFGGHEQSAGTVLTGPGSGKGTCPDCPGTFVEFGGTMCRLSVVSRSREIDFEWAIARPV